MRDRCEPLFEPLEPRKLLNVDLPSNLREFEDATIQTDRFNAPYLVFAATDNLDESETYRSTSASRLA